ncbi:MAG: hypothetical protein VKP57_04850 [Candidatus Sericytochromatia bacterium]|nr:hypothetical protein [Candidatus Sericytochromatia bacterium]
MGTVIPTARLAGACALLTLATGCGTPGQTGLRPGASGTATALAGSGHQPRQVEIRAELTAEGHALLAAQGGWSSPRTRTDLYFDAFDGRAWAWRDGKTAWKLRIKRKVKSSEMQLRRPLSRESAPPGALPLTMNVTESWAATMFESQVMALWEPGLAMLDTLQQGDLPTRKAMTDVDKAWQGQLWAGADALAGARKAQPGVIVPTHRADKHLLEQTMAFGRGWKADVVLGTSRTQDGAGTVTVRHEIEIEPGRDAPEAAMAMQDVSAWLAASGLAMKHIAPTPADPTLAAARAYGRVGARRSAP